jgi:hypothetical protein
MDFKSQDTDHPAAAPPDVEENNSQSPDQEPPKKRNSGKTGPTSAAGKFNSAQNARTHGACARTLILPVESEQGWLILLSRWQDIYQPREESLEADFVLRTAQAEWFRIRVCRQYDEFIKSTLGQSPLDWTPEQLKMHELMLRYKNGAERSFHREYRALETFYKIHNLLPKPPQPEPEEEEIPELLVELAPIEEILKNIAKTRSRWTDIPEDKEANPPDPPSTT